MPLIRISFSLFSPSQSRADVDQVKAAMDEENERLMRESKRQDYSDSDDSVSFYRLEYWYTRDNIMIVSLPLEV